MIAKKYVEKTHPIKTMAAVFTLERFTEVSEFTYLGKYFAYVNANSVYTVKRNLFARYK